MEKAFPMLSVHFNYAIKHVSRNMATTMRAQTSAMEKLASGYKINTAADGPADLIMSEKLRAQIEGLERAIRNTNESGNILGIMEGGLSQVQGILDKMRGLAIETANIGIINGDRIAANQAEMDSGLQAIDRILGTINYGGRKLLDNVKTANNLGDNFNAIANTGQALRDYPELSALLEGEDAGDGSLFILHPDQNHLPQVENGVLVNGDKTFILRGMDGAPEEGTRLVFSEGETLDAILVKLREHAALLPPEAGQAGHSLADGRRGSDINRVELDAGSLAALANMSDADAVAMLSGHMEDFTREMELDIAGWKQLSDADKELLKVGGTLADMGLGSLGSVQVEKGTDKNGNTIYGNLSLNDLYSGGAASLHEDPLAAMSVLKQASDDVSAHRASIAAAQTMLVHQENAMEAEREGLTRLESYLRDTDFAEATTELARTQVLAQAGYTLIKAATDQYRQILDIIS